MCRIDHEVEQSQQTIAIINEKPDPSPGTFADLETEMEDDSLQKQNSLELALNLASPMSPILTLEHLRKSV